MTTLIGFAVDMRLLATAVAEKQKRLPSVSKVVITGSPLPAASVKTFKAVYQLKELRNLYGSTEAGIVICTPCNQVSLSDIGFPGPNVQVKVIYFCTEYFEEKHSFLWD